MGNSDSKNKKKNTKGSGKKKGQSDDGCIGNRRVRTIVLSVLLILFSIFALPWIFDRQESIADLQEINEALPDFAQNDTIESMYHATNCIAAGLIIILAGAICAIILFFIPGCDDKLGKVAGFILIVGGLVYVIGVIWAEFAAKSFLTEEIAGVSAWGLMSDEAKQQFNAGMWARIGEGLLFGISAILLGVDALLQWYEDEAKRLSANLGLLLAVSIMAANAYYLQICGDDTLCVQRDGVGTIATGYLVIFWTALVYIILYICTCCTCDCKDKCLIRVILAVCLVIGGVLCSIGYYVYSGGYSDAGTDDAQGKLVAYYIGYTVLIGGLCITWALDIALDDVKNR